METNAETYLSNLENLASRCGGGRSLILVRVGICATHGPQKGSCARAAFNIPQGDQRRSVGSIQLGHWKISPDPPSRLNANLILANLQIFPSLMDRCSS